jgi:hypothetical protein
MAQQIINTGEEPNDGTGEPLRSAFTAVNDNFSEIYAAGPVGSNVVISANTISRIGTNGNLILAANGVGNVQFNSSIEPAVNAVFNIGNPSAQFKTIYAENFIGNGAGLTGIGSGGSGNSISNGASNVVIATQDGNVVISVDGSPNVAVFQKRNVVFTANVLPTANSVYDIGTTNQRFRDLYLAGETIFLGNAQLSANSTAITITNPAGGRFIFSAVGDFGPYGNSSVESFLPTYTGNLRSLQGNVWTTANVRASNLLANNVVSTRDLLLSGNIIGTPGVTTLSGVTFSITDGSLATLTVSNSIIGTGFISLGGNITGGNINTGGTINSNSGINTGGNITAVNVTATGNIVTGSGSGGNITGANVISANTVAAAVVSASGNITANYFIGNGSLLTGLPESYSNANVASYLLTNTGNIAAGTFISNNIVSANTLTFSANAAQLVLQASNTAPVLQPNANVSFFIRTQDAGTYQFEFDTDGTLTVPTAVYAPLVSTIDLVTNTIRSDDSSAVTVDDELSVSGVIRTGQSVSASGNVIGDFFIGNGRHLTGIVASSIGVLPSLTVSGNILSGNVNVQQLLRSTNISATGNIIGATGAKIDGFAIGTITPEDARFDDVTVLGNLLVEKTTTAANIVANGTVSVSGQITAASVNSIGNLFAGNISTANISATDINAVSLSTSANVSAQFFIGNGSLLTGVVSSYGNSNVQSYLPTYTGNLVSLQGNITTTANVSANNISASNLLIASRLATTGDALIGGNLVVNGNTIQVNVEELNVEDPVIGLGRGANNAPLTVDDGKSRGVQLWYYDTAETQAFVGWDNANNVLIAAANVEINNDIVTVNNYGRFVTGNITAGSITSSGNIITGSGTGGNITGANVISANTVVATAVAATTITASGNVSLGSELLVNGNITANTYFGSAAGLTFIPAGNIVGTVALAQSANTANTVTASNQSNITSVGTLTALTVSGNVVVDTNTLVVREDLNAVGVGAAPTNKLTVVDVAAAVSNVQVPAVFYSSNIIAGEQSLISVGRDSVNRANFGYLYAGNADSNNSVVLGVDGNAALSINADNVAAFEGNVQIGTILIDQANADISGLTSINTSVVSATGNIAAANFATAGQVSAAGNIVGNNVSAANLIVAAQASITGNISAGNISAANISATGAVNTPLIQTSTINATGNISAAGNVIADNFIGNLVGSFTAPGSNTQVLFNENNVIGARNGLVFDYVGNILTVGGNITTTNAGSLNVAGAISVTGNVTVATGNINGGNILGTLISASGNITGGNLNTGGAISATGNIFGANVNASGLISSVGAVIATGNVSGGNIITTGAISSTGTATVGNVNTGGVVSATGNVTGGNINSAGIVSAAGNVVGGNIDTAGTITAVGTITGGNISTGGFVSATGNIIGGNLSGLGISGTLLTAAQTNITSVGTLVDLSVTGTVTSGNVSTVGFVSATGNITAGNLISTTLSLSGNVISDINSVNDITTTGNITANNIAATTSININGNQVATVDDATALAIALG